MTGLEIELKAGVPEADLVGIAQYLEQRWGQGAPPERLLARYFDSADERLARNGIALRVRAEGGQLVQTVKSGRTVIGGFHQVREADAIVGRWGVDTGAINPPALRDALLSALDGAPLKVRFETDVVRQRWVVRHDHGVVEVALDVGAIRAGEAVDPVSEMELELIEGSPEALFELAGELLAPVPALLALPSKAARGQALLAGVPWRADVSGGKPAASTAGEAGEASWKRALALLADAIGTNLYLLFQTTDPEAAHQLRVALRRFRAAVHLHQPLIDRKLARSLSGKARDIGRIVAPLRDCDVLTAALGEVPALEAALAAHRQAVRADVVEGLRQAGATAFVVRLLGLAALGGWQHDGKARPLSINELTETGFGALWRKAGPLGDRLSALEDCERHELRKTLKKVRYLLEYASEKSGIQILSPNLKKLQEELGFLNDASALKVWNPDLPEALQAEFEAAKAQLARQAVQRADLALGRACRHWRDLRRRVFQALKPPAP
jgi:inorganic triphosphatase YgiF